MPGTREQALKNLKKKKTRGRPKGAKNKVRGSLITQILEITAHLKEKGMGLEHCAEENPKWFFENFYKAIIPKNVQHSGDPGNPLEVIFGLTEKAAQKIKDEKTRIDELARIKNK